MVVVVLLAVAVISGGGELGDGGIFISSAWSGPNLGESESGGECGVVDERRVHLGSFENVTVLVVLQNSVEEVVKGKK